MLRTIPVRFEKLLVVARQATATIATCVIVLGTANLLAQLPSPELKTIYPPGGKQGTSVEVTISGGDLDDASRFQFSHPGITATQKMSEATDLVPSRPVPNQFIVNIAGDVPPGVYQSRVIGRFGVSNPRTFAVGLFEELPDDGSNQRFEAAKEIAIGTTFNGRIEGSIRDHFKLVLEQGQRVIIDCAAQRIDSKLDGTLVVLDPSGRELVRERDTIGLDPLLDFTAPAAGPYIVAVYDFLYRGGTEYFYRLSFHSGPVVDFVFPPSGIAGSTDKFTVYGRNLPGGQPAEGVSINGQPLEKVVVDIAMPGDEVAARQLAVSSFAPPRTAALDRILYQFKTPQGDADPVPIYFARSPIVAEVEPNNEPANSQTITVPCEYVGQFYPERDEDWLQFEAKKGEVYVIDLISHRLGLESDPYFLVQRVAKNDKGEESISDITQQDDPGDRNNRIGSDFDTSTDDPSFRFQVPDDGTYRIKVRDQFGDSRQDPRYVYRLVIRNEEPDFRLVALPQPNRVANNNQVPVASAVIRRGGTSLVEVRAERRDGFNGEIDITAEGLPNGISCDGAIIAENAISVSLIFSAAEDAAAWTGPIRIVGRTKIGDQDVVREARSGSVVWPTGNRQQDPPEFRVTDDVVLAVVDKETEIAQVQVGEPQIYETSRGGNLELPVKVTRRGDFKAELKLVATDVPNEIKPPDVTVKGNESESKLVIQVTNNNAKPGIYTFYLKGDAKFNYLRNTDAIAAAEEEQKRVDALVKELTEANTKATEAKNAAVKAATDSTNALKQAEQVKATAETEAQKAAEAAKQAADKFVAASEAAQKDAGNQTLADAAKAAEQAKNEAEAQSKAAAEKLAAAEKALADAQTAAKSADEAKATGEKAAADADAKLKAVQQLKQAADKDVNDVKNANKPNANMTISVISTPIRLRVVDSPLNVTAQSPGGALKQGEKVDVPVKVERLYGFADGVELTLEPPNGVAGLTINKLNLNADQADGKFEVAAADNATPGEHTVTVRAKAKFNNVNVESTGQVVLKVEAKAAE